MATGLMRASAAFFPLSLMLCALIGDSRAQQAFLLFYFALQLLSFCAVDAFQNAAARETSVRRVDRRFGGAWLQLLIGALALWLLAARYLGGPSCTLNWRPVLGAAALSVAEQLFEERVFALGRRLDGALLSLISSVLLLAGLQLDAAAGVASPLAALNGGFFLLGGAALGALIALTLSVTVSRGAFAAPSPGNYGFAPRALLQTLLYPAACALIMMKTRELSPAPALFGLALWRLARTNCRRTRLESRPLDFALTLAAALALIAGALTGCAGAWAACALLALLCAEAAFCAPSARLYLSTLALAGGFALMRLSPLEAGLNLGAVCGCALLGAGLNLHKTLFMRRARRVSASGPRRNMDI